MTEWLVGYEARFGGMGFVALTNFIMKTRELHCTKVGKMQGYIVLFFAMQDSNSHDPLLCPKKKYKHQTWGEAFSPFQGTYHFETVDNILCRL